MLKQKEETEMKKNNPIMSTKLLIHDLRQIIELTHSHAAVAANFWKS